MMGKHWDSTKMLLTHQILSKIQRYTKVPCTSVSETSSTWTNSKDCPELVLLATCNHLI